ncbi:MAG: acetate--CoA ligase family protein [Boseongicola sp. SB0662_bin_57]|nr:acetate--CoA ligase family protein [Boseongicola sp. SB0662_bin_57]
MGDLQRLFRPRTIAVIGGGAWCTNVIRECRRIGFDGAVWPVHPTRHEIDGLLAYRSVEALPSPPDASFLGINREATIEVVRSLRLSGAGGAICFASGFREAEAELGDGGDMQESLLEAAGGLRVLGPNCYGLLNLLDGVALWPDQHGARRTGRGVAVITQSSNMALNLTMQTRGLPLAYVVAGGNQAQTDQAEVASMLLEDERVTALGLHVEGIGNVHRFEAMARRAHSLGKSIVALKVGASEQAQAGTVSHTASLAGSAAGARALLARLGIGQVESLPVFLETLKLLHVTGPLDSNRIASMSCSGGEASLVADTALSTGLEFPPLSERQRADLATVLGHKVALANPLDYHTYIWRDGPALTGCFTAMMQGDLGLGMVILDMPHADRCDRTEWDSVLEAVETTREVARVPMAIVSTLPENMPEDVSDRLVANGVAPLAGIPEALAAIDIAAQLGRPRPESPPLLLPGPEGRSRVLAEAEAKSALAVHGLDVPRGAHAVSPEEAVAAAEQVGFPLVLKGEGTAHKTEAGAIALDLHDPAAVGDEARRMKTDGYLVEEMVTGTVAELLLGVIADPAHGFVLTLGAGGTMTEILEDVTSLLLPVTEDDIHAALGRLRIASVLSGYRGAAAADCSGIASAVLAVQDYVTANAETVLEVEVNPLIATSTRAVAVDALIRLRDER